MLYRCDTCGFKHHHWDDFNNHACPTPATPTAYEGSDEESRNLAALAYAREKFAHSFFPGQSKEECASMRDIWAAEFIDGWNACLEFMREKK